MRLKLVFAMFVCALVVMSVGCARTTATTAAESADSAQGMMLGMPLAADFRIADLPMPADFDFDREHSFVFQNSRMDVGRIQYKGKASIEDVAQFYLDEMTNYNWVLVNVTEHGSIMLFFEKPDKSAQVVLSSKARTTTIQISFFPKNSTAEPES